MSNFNKNNLDSGIVVQNESLAQFIFFWILYTRDSLKNVYIYCNILLDLCLFYDFNFLIQFNQFTNWPTYLMWTVSAL